MGTLRERIEKFLERHGRNQREWALELGITPAYLSQIVNGERIPALPLAIRMSRETKIPIDMFVPGGEKTGAVA
jgi:transcriptional regulator with XRE-family HTH domain